ncbi:synaptophysin-like protein 1 [Notolabrus celidotus]|uniref:synaptophysin-like protein 1 n=1 Tax=Notolabrus celidotus TaxID=1203425 RepID=UPI00148F4C08|nr:synaptophysin-like protein 1 [Notolabrus celidotus]XP_034528904.1 synaptophysin-like protein 1 [Notolabrus celidotus]XP_034528905.1 synaptophysin-like protein 1 [Notolabrus celidotus]XP_034528906.1 synaptophysin-like protein 1 [Notolabrus celidotus]
MTGFRLNFSPLKEPLGFIKLVEWLTAVFAFGSCGGFSGKNILSVLCGDGRNETLNANFHYPFRLSQVPLIDGNTTVCNHSVTLTHMVGDSASSAEFFVGVAIICFLQSMVALLVYLGYMHIYKNSEFGPILDFVVTAILVFLWLVSSSAWAKGLQNVKYATDTEGLSATLDLCKDGGITCEVTEYANLRTLNISVVFGFLNMFVWAINAWFVYKETRWHSQKFSSAPGPGRQHVPATI